MSQGVPRQNTHLRALLDRAPLGICLVDADLRVQEINSAALQLFGDASRQMVGRDFSDAVHVAWETTHAEEIIRSLLLTLETGEPCVFKTSAGTRVGRGQAKLCEWRLERIVLQDGRHGVACYLRESNDGGQAGQDAQRLASIVECSDDAIVSKDLNGLIVSWNQGAERLFGYAADEVIGRHISIIIPKDRRDEEPEILGRIRRGERVDHYETVRQRRDGSLVDISLTVSPVQDGSGKVIGASKIARDISQRKEAEATQRLLLGELNHRVKNTLASVQAIVQQTLRRTKDPSDFAPRFAGRLQSLASVHSLLTESLWQGADLRELIHDQLVKGVVDQTRLTTRGPAVRLGSQMATHMALMLHELGTNSVKHGGLSTPEGWVSVHWSVSDGALRLSWVERGGPPASTPLERGFGTLLIEHSATSVGGAAEMICESDGVTWNIHLPLPQTGLLRGSKQEYECEATTPAKSPARNAQPGRLAGLRFLVVEDEPVISLELASCLERAGVSSTCQAGAENDALRAIEGNQFDGALLDANLHGRPVDRIASALAWKRVPFIFVTGYGRDSLPKGFSHAPILAKPFCERDLIAALAEVIATHADAEFEPSSVSEAEQQFGVAEIRITKLGGIGR